MGKIKKINVHDLVSIVPDLSKLSITGADENFRGRTFLIDTAEAQWKTTVDKMPPRKVDTRDITLSTSEGQIILHKAFWTSYEGGGNLEGTCTHVNLIKSVLPDPSKVRFRSIIYLDKKPSLTFPHSIQDETAAVWSGWLPLSSGKRQLDLYYLPSEQWIILDSNEGLSFDEFQKISGTTRVLFSYLLGISLDQRSCELAISIDGKNVYEAWWYSGRSRIASSYTPIPSSWGHWAMCKRKLTIPPGMRHLDDIVLSKVWSNLLNWQELIVSIEYLLTFPSAPVEMRGALLSVALESLTTFIEKKLGVIKVPNPLEKSTWKKFRGILLEYLDNKIKTSIVTNLIELVNIHGSTWPKDTKEIFISRIYNLNKPTNRAKLTAPFQYYGISITDTDAEAIDKRNSFLHEGQLLNEEARKKGDTWREVYYTEMRIYTLTNSLLLAALEYEGPLINWGETLLGGGETQYLYYSKKS